jgi:multiple antibiotic resistance protein
VNRYLGEQGVDALTRIMGFLLVCIGVQFIVIGIFEVLADPELLAPVYDAAHERRSR